MLQRGVALSPSVAEFRPQASNCRIPRWAGLRQDTLCQLSAWWHPVDNLHVVTRHACRREARAADAAGWRAAVQQWSPTLGSLVLRTPQLCQLSSVPLLLRRQPLLLVLLRRRSIREPTPGRKPPRGPSPLPRNARLPPAEIGRERRKAAPCITPSAPVLQAGGQLVACSLLQLVLQPPRRNHCW